MKTLNSSCRLESQTGDRDAQRCVMLNKAVSGNHFKINNLSGTFQKVQENCKRVALLYWDASLEDCFPAPQDPDCLGLHAALRRLLEEGRVAMEAMQVPEVPLPPPRRKRQDRLREDPLLGKGRTTGAGDPGELGPGQTEACKVSRCCTKLLSEELSRCR